MGQALLSWFEKHRKSKTLGLAQNQILKSINTVTELEKAITAFSKNSKSEAEKAIERLFKEEVEVDDLRRAIFKELINGTLPAKYREDLKALIERLDRMADFVKDAARSIVILIESKSQIPTEILDSVVNMAKSLRESTIFLSTSIEMLGINPPQAKEFAQKVDEVEGHIDEYHFKAKTLFIKHAEVMNVPTFLVMKDLVDSMEQAADMCADTADFIRVLSSAS